MTKPISNLRDYNGTYSGAPETGSIMYRNGNSPGTLYRDNEDYGATSGCNGEGCGKHPGVDVPVSSRTNVYASLGGTVVRSECNGNGLSYPNGSGWGGLIVVQATSPYTGETIYFTYAHLHSRNYSVSQTVSEGAIIGQSGGGSGDTCPGNSSGPHLHFQIDKNDGNNDPWFPNNVNQADTNFEVTNYTFNPIVFVTGKYNWTFDLDGFAEYWTAQNVSSWGINYGTLWIDGNSDPYVWRNGNVTCEFSVPGGRPCSGQIAAEASLYRYAQIALYNTCISNPVKIYFTTNSEDYFDEAKSVSFNYTGYGSYLVNMGNNAKWTGIIKRLRVDPAVNCDPSSADYDYIYYITIQR